MREGMQQTVCRELHEMGNCLRVTRGVLIAPILLKNVS